MRRTLWPCSGLVGLGRHCLPDADAEGKRPKPVVSQTQSDLDSEKCDIAHTRSECDLIAQGDRGFNTDQSVTGLLHMCLGMGNM